MTLTDEEFRAYKDRLAAYNFDGDATWASGKAPETVEEWQEAFRDCFRAAGMRIRALEDELKKARA